MRQRPKKGKHLTATEKDQVEDRLVKSQRVIEWLIKVLEATKDHSVVEALAKWSPLAEAFGKSLAAVPGVGAVIKILLERLKVKDPGELGYLAATLAYQRAVEQAMLEVVHSNVSTRTRSVEPEVREFALKRLRAEAPSELYDFSSFSFDQALNSPFIQSADRVLEISAHGMGFDATGFLILQRKVRYLFVPELAEILNDGSTRERFAPFRDQLTLGTLEIRAYQALKEHEDFQCWLYEERPVLGQEPFTLKQVYTETDCGILRWEEIDTKRQRREVCDPSKEGGRHPPVETVLALIADAKFRDAIVIQGVAGSGKSSLSLRLAWELSQQGLKPIRIELKDLSFESSEILETLPAAVRITSPERNPGAIETFGKELFLGWSIFDERPVVFRGTQICPYVLILDGWDEISVGAAEGYQQQVARLLGVVRSKLLERRASPVRIILTGRLTPVIEESKLLRPETHILTVRDFLPEQLESYVERVKAATTEASKLGRASWTLDNVKNLPDVLARYRKARQEASQSETPPSGDERLEILGLPLLAHLALRLLAERPDAVEQILENNTTILYRSLVDLVVGQAGKPVEAKKDVLGNRVYLVGDDLRKLLRGTAEAMTTLGVEAIPYYELAERLDLKDVKLSSMVDSILPTPAEKTEKTGRALLSLIVSFFFKGGRTALGAEFSHKSFREFLFAEQIIEELKAYGSLKVDEEPVERKSGNDYYWRDFDDGDPRRALCHRLAELLGPNWITPEVARHLRRLLAWEIGRAVKPETDRIGEPTSPLSREQWNRVRDGLADAWDWWGEGVHLRPQPIHLPPQPKEKEGRWEYGDGSKPLALQVVEESRFRSDLKKRPTPARTTTVDAHLGYGLFLLTAVVHAEIALQGEKPEAVWTEGGRYTGSPRRYQRRLERGQKEIVIFAPSGLDHRFFLNYCARINAGGWCPLDLFPGASDLRVVYLRGADLRGASLGKADLRGADLRGADLRGALIDPEQLKLARTDEETLA